MKVNLAITYHIFLVLLSVSCNINSQNPYDDLKMYGEKMKQHEHIEYTYLIDIYRSYSGKSPSRHGQIYFESYPQDSIIGMRYYNKGNPYESFYNGDFLCIMNSKDSSIYKKPLVDYQNGHGTVYPCLELSFCAIKLFLNSPNLVTEIDSLIRRDTIIDSKQCDHFSFWADQKFLSTHKAFKKRPKKVEIIFCKTDFLPVYYSQEETFFSGKQSYTNFSEARFNQYALTTKYPSSRFDIESVDRFYDWSKMMMQALGVNKLAPDWKLPSLDDDSLSLSNYRGRYVLLDFWYIGCGPCIKSIPTLNSIHQNYSHKELVVIGVNCLSDNKSKVQAYCSNHKMLYQNVWKGDLISEAYKIKGAPVYYLINPAGYIVYSQIGHDDQKLIKNIQRFIN